MQPLIRIYNASLIELEKKKKKKSPIAARSHVLRFQVVSSIKLLVSYSAEDVMDENNNFKTYQLIVGDLNNSISCDKKIQYEFIFYRLYFRE